MTCFRRSTALAALLLTLCLAAPSAALQRGARFADNDTRTEAIAERSWFATLAETAWSWIYGLWDEDNGHITP